MLRCSYSRAVDLVALSRDRVWESASLGIQGRLVQPVWVASKELKLTH